MAQKIEKQLNFGVNIKLGRGGKSVGTEVAQQITKSVGPALEKALTQAVQNAFKGVRAQLDQIAKDAAQAGSRAARSASSGAAQRLRGGGGGGAGGGQGGGAGGGIGVPQVGPTAGTLRQARRLQRATGMQLPLGHAEAALSGMEPRRQLETIYEAEDATRGRKTKDKAAAEEIRRKTKAERAQQKSDEKRSREAVQEANKQDRGIDRARGQAARQAAAAEKREEAGQQKVSRRAFSAEREIARLRGEEDPRLAGLRSTHPALAQSLGRERGLSSRFPGAAGMARAMGSPKAIGLIRGGMAAGPLLAGVASGNPLLGAGGGATSGAMAGSLMGLGGLGGGLMAGGGAIVGALAAAVVMGVQRGMANVPAAVAFRRAGMGPLGVAPSQQGNIGVHRGAFENMMLRQSAIGMDPMEALQIAGTVQQGAGWAGTPSSRLAIQEALQLSRTNFGINTDDLRSLELSRRRGGMTGIAGLGAGRVAGGLVERALGLGFQGDEVGGLIGQLAGSAAQARGQGTFANLGSQMSTIGALSPSIGQFQGARVAGGLQGAVSSIASQGISGAPNPAVGLMMMQAFGGLELGRKGGVSATDIFAAQARMEREGVTPEGVSRMAGFFKKAAGGSPALQSMMMQRGMAQLGLPMGPGIIESMRRGSPANDDIAATITSAVEGQRELTAFRERGLGGRAAALAPPEMQREALTRAQDIRSGLVRSEASQSLDQAAANLGVMTTRIETVNAALDAFARTLQSLTIP